MTGTNAYSISRLLRSLRWFALGKMVSAPLSFLLVLVLTAKMGTHEYAAYVAALAVLEIGVAAGTVGIDWLMQTAVAGIRVHGSSRELRRVVIVMLFAAIVPYALLAGLLALAAPLLSQAMGNVVSVEVLRLYAVVLVIEGVNRMHRDNLLAILMVQGAVQIAQLSRVVSMFLGVVVVLMSGVALDSVHVAYAEICASIVSTVITLWAIGKQILVLDDDTDTRPLNLKQYFGPSQLRFAWHAYSSFMFTILISAEITTALIARYLGAEATATFGFTWKLLETGRRFLPMDLFYGLIRPATIGRFKSSNGDRHALVRDSNLFLKANILVLGAGMAIALGLGDWLVETLSHGTVTAPPLLMAALLTTVYGHSLRRSVELIAFVGGHADLFQRASFCCVLAPGLMFMLLPSEFGNLYVVAAILIGIDILFSSIVIGGLRLRFSEMRMEFSTLLKLALASALAGGAAALVVHLYPTTIGQALAGCVAVGVYLTAIAVGDVLSRTEIDYIRHIVRSRAS